MVARVENTITAEPGGHILYLKKRHCGQGIVHSVFAVIYKKSIKSLFCQGVLEKI